MVVVVELSNHHWDPSGGGYYIRGGQLSHCQANWVSCTHTREKKHSMKEEKKTNTQSQNVSPMEAKLVQMALSFGPNQKEASLVGE